MEEPSSPAPLRQLAPNPLHVLTPRPSEMDRISREYGKGILAPTCPTCANRGTFHWYDENGTVVEWECNCDEQLVLYRWFLSHGIRPLYQRLGWRDLNGLSAESMKKVSEWLQVLDAYAIGAGPSIWMSGTRGTGKTLVASLLQRTLLHSKVECQQIDAQSIGSLINNWRDDDVKEWWMRRVRSAPVLIIDDLGRERGQEEWVQARVVELARFRLESMLPTIITGNFTVTDAQAKYGSEFVAILDQADKHDFISGEVRHRQMNETIEQRQNSPLRPPIVFG